MTPKGQGFQIFSFL